MEKEIKEINHKYRGKPPMSQTKDSITVSSGQINLQKMILSFKDGSKKSMSSKCITCLYFSPSHSMSWQEWLTLSLWSCSSSVLFVSLFSTCGNSTVNVLSIKPFESFWKVCHMFCHFSCFSMFGLQEPTQCPTLSFKDEWKSNDIIYEHTFFTYFSFFISFN